MDKFVTSRGIEVEFRPVPKELMMRFNAANPQPKPPTYTVTSTVTGTTQNIEIDEQSIREKSEQFTPEQHAAWNEYAAKQGEWVERFIKFFCIRGLTVRAAMDDWLEEQKFLNIPISENKSERKFEWITSEVLETADDYKAVVLGVIEASGVPADLLQQVSDSFRGDVQRSAAQPDGDVAKQVEGIAELRRSEGDVAPETHAKRMGKTKRARPRVGDGDAGNT